MGCDCGSKYNSGFHSVWCATVTPPKHAYYMEKEFAWFTRNLSDSEVDIFRQWWESKPIPVYGADSPIYWAIWEAISQGFG